MIDKIGQTHSFEVKNMEANVKMQLIMTYSTEASNLWTTSNSNSIVKLKSIFAKEGC